MLPALLLGLAIMDGCVDDGAISIEEKYNMDLGQDAPWVRW
jgi:hypothetical protein